MPEKIIHYIERYNINDVGKNSDKTIHLIRTMEINHLEKYAKPETWSKV